MTPDLLDDLLDRSTPATRGVSDADLSAMASEARREAAPQRRGIGKAAIGVGVLALFFGGAGTAIATDGYVWAPFAQNAQRSVEYTAPTWGECELRYGDFAAANPLEQFAVDGVIDDFFARTDLAAASAALVPKYLAQLESDQAAAAEPVDDPRVIDLNYWIATDQAVSELISAELEARGYAGTEVTGSASQVHCEGEQW